MSHETTHEIDHDAVEIKLFGGFSLRVAGATQPRPPPRVRQVLALAAVTELSIDATLDQIWSSDLPANPRRAFQVIVSRCRTALGTQRDRLDIDRGMLRLDADCDVLRFQTLIWGATDDQIADAARRLADLTEAFAIRDGLPLDTCDQLPFLVSLQRELDAMTRQAGVEAGRLMIEMGHAASAVQLLDPIWHETPHDEAVGLTLAEALASNAQRSRALEVLDATRVAMRDIYGVSLGAAADELLYDLLRGSDGYEPARPYAADQPSGVPVVGVRRILSDIPTDSGDVTVIEAYAGDGKSTIGSQIVDRWTKNGRLTVRVEVPANPTAPMQVVTEIITALIDQESIDPNGLDEQTAAAVRRLLPELPGEATRFAITRESLIALLSELIAGALNSRAGALLIDDLQFCDWGSIEVLRGVIDAAEQPVVVTTRIARPGYVEELVRHPRCHRVRLNGLKRHEVAEIAERCLPGRRVDIDALYERSGGHPLFVSLLVGLLIDGDVGDDLPATVLLAVRHRTAILSREANEALSLLSLFPNGTTIDVVRQIRPTIATEVVELGVSGLLHSGPELRIRHAIVCEAVKQLIPRGMLLSWHDQIGWLIQGQGFPASSWVDHTLAAAEFDPQRAFTTAVAAAAEYANAFAWERVLKLAIDALDVGSTFELNDPRTEALANLWAGRAQLALSMADEGDGALLRAVDIAETIGDDALLAEAVVELCTFGRISPTDRLGDQLHARIERLLSGALDPELRCELAAAAGTLLSVSRLQQHGRDLFMTGYREAQTLGDVEVERRVLLHLHLALGHPADLDTRIAGARRLSEIAGTDPDLRWQARYLDFGIGLMTANREQIDASIVELRDLAPRLRLRDRSFGLAFTEASYARVLGDLDQAERLVAKAAELGRQRFPEKWVTFVVMAIVAAVSEARGRLGALLPFADSRIANNPAFPIWHVIAAASASDLGDDERVQTELSFLRQIDFAIVPDLSWSAAVSLLAAPVALAADSEAATVLGDALRPFSGQMTWNGITTHYPVDHYLAIYDDVIGSGLSTKYRRRAVATIEALTTAPAVAQPTR